MKTTADVELYLHDHYKVLSRFLDYRFFDNEPHEMSFASTQGFSKR